ncbi:MAG: hypothetical protein EBT08_00705 [Betaproteobacteria bacterium]|nr:hypothetical protein [Betaproteobacteria bacterium]
MTLLARRRPWASSAHLALSYLRLQPMGTPSEPEKGGHDPRAAQAAWTQAALILSVSKRLAPAAPVRNAIRRVLRESWRACGLASRGHPLAVMIRLRALPLALPAGAAGASTGASPGVTPAVMPSAIKPPKGRAVLRVRRTDRALKAVIRAEADALLDALCRSAPAVAAKR